MVQHPAVKFISLVLFNDITAPQYLDPLICRCNLQQTHLFIFSIL